LHALIRANPFATLVLSDGPEVIANHVPVLLRAAPAAKGQLVGHVARANPVWEIAPSGSRALIIFQGPAHYISPRWYKSGRAADRALPTWDYAVVHARGAIEWIFDEPWLKEMLDDMTKTFERGTNPWGMAEMPDGQLESMLGHIVGFEIGNVEYQGKFKLNQGSSAEDRADIAAELASLGTDCAKELAAAMALVTKEQ
jgi:transcriptional regulator